VQSPPVPAGVGRTALGVARIRAAESQRPDRLFDDPLASAFAAALPDDDAPPGAHADAEPPDPDAPGVPGDRLIFQIVIRTRFYDQYLSAAAAAGCRQVVLLAAGLDSRAFRLDWPPGLRLFELDQPDVLDFKEAVLRQAEARPRCQRTVIAADLRGGWQERLTGAGFDPARPSAWLVEGLLIYLARDEAARLLTEVGELAAPDSRLSLERGDQTARLISQTRRASPRGARLAALWKGGLGEDAAGWLAAHGWQATTHDSAALARDYGRPVPGEVRGGFVIAVRPG
jgi:methyltransferase (TIGR00027 family)